MSGLRWRTYPVLFMKMTNMTDHPYIAQPWQVRAALEDRLSLIIEPVPVQPSKDQEFGSVLSDRVNFTNKATGSCFPVPLPFTVGDRLWCREKWAQCRRHEEGPAFHPHYAADGEVTLYNEATDDRKLLEWWPPTSMPRWASRLTLTVTGVEVRRLWDVTDKEAYEAGAQPVLEYAEGPAGSMPCGYGPAIPDFQEKWHRAPPLD